MNCIITFCNIIILGIALSTIKISLAHRAVYPPVPGLPPNTDPTKKTTAANTSATTPMGPIEPQLLENYIPPCMQALAYYIELLQYEPVRSTTIIPPDGWETSTYVLPRTSPRPITQSTTKSPTIWWQPQSTMSTIWWVPPSTTSKTTTVKTTTKRVNTMLTTKPTTPSKKTTQIAITTTRKPSYDEPITTKKPSSTSSTWWQPPSWWTTSSTPKPNSTPTKPHTPGLFAPAPPQHIEVSLFSRPAQTPIRPINHNSLIENTSNRKPTHTNNHEVPPINYDSDFMNWFLQKRATQHKPEHEYDFNLLDPLPGGLIQDIIHEKSELPAIADSDNIDEFLKVYDDTYKPVTGKKRIPITKPYVEFLMLYDLLKRDAKAMNLSKYEGYSEKMMRELIELSTYPAELQLHALLSRMLLRQDIERNDVITKTKNIITDLENATSITTKAMRYFPALQFVP